VIRPSLLTLLAVPAGVLALAGPARAATNCTNLKPTAVKLKTNAAGTSTKVTWRKPSHAPASLQFRVARDGKVVGQTRGRRMNVRTSAGKPSKITLTVLVNGRLTRCKVTKRLRVVTKGPGRVTGLAVIAKGQDRVVLSWDPATRGDAAITRYRVDRDGRTLRQLKGRKLTVKISSNRTNRYRVAAVDKNGKVGRGSAQVTVKTGHRAPSAPVALAASDVADTEATLSWGAVKAVRGRISSYRVLNAAGLTVRAASATNTRLTGLPTAQTRTYRVVAIDSLGWTSKSSDPVTFTTGHTAPGTPGAPRADSVTDTSVSLTWARAPLPSGAKLRGYRVMRDGAVVSQVTAEAAQIGNLAAKATYGWSIAAVDTRGYVSPASPVTQVAQADPPPTTGDAHAFLLASTDASYAAFRRHYRQVGTVHPTFWDCSTTTAAIVGRNDAPIVTYAQDRKIKVLPRFNCQRAAIVHKILTDPATRAAWLDGMVATADQYGYDGLNLDFEAIDAPDRDALTSFVAELATRLHARGKLLTQAVSAKTEDVMGHPRSTAFDYVELSKYVDHVFVMAWGIHWATSAPGAQDDYGWVTQVADYVASLPRKEKFVMGTMLYGMDWPNGGGSLANEASGRYYDDIMALSAQYGVAPEYDPTKDSWHLAYHDAAGVPRDVWYSDATNVANRLKLARDRGLGIGFWRLGQEDERIWSSPLVGGTA
jgi:spore germination protein YaaH